MMNKIEIFKIKVAKLVLIIQLFQQCLSNSNVTSSFSGSGNQSILMVNSSFMCPDGSLYPNGTAKAIYNAFEGVQSMIDYLITDYNSTNGHLSKKPNTVILTLNLNSNQSAQTCYINKVMNIYNPFILGKHNPQYKTVRTQTGDKCCLDLEHTYDFQLIIEGPVVPVATVKLNRVKLSTGDNIKSYRPSGLTNCIYLHHFPTVKIRRLNIESQGSVYLYNPVVHIIGYEFGKDIDLSPSQERIKRFKKSSFVMEETSIYTNALRFIRVDSTYYNVNLNSFSVYGCQTPLNVISVKIQRSQMNYISRLENSLENQFKIRQIQYNIYNIEFQYQTIQGNVFSILMDNTTRAYDDSFAIQLKIKKWTMQRIATAKHHQVPSTIVRYTLVTDIESGLIKTQIEDLSISASQISSPVFGIYNLSRFDNIVITGNIFTDHAINARIFRSQNVQITNNNLIGTNNVVRITATLPNNKTEFLTNDYSSCLKDWLVSGNIADRITTSLDLATRSFFYIKSNIDSGQTSTVFSNVSSEIETLKTNLAVKFDNLTVSNNKLGTTHSLVHYQYSPMITVEKGFYFEMLDCKLIKNQYFTSTNIMGVNYVNVTRMVVGNSTGWPQSYTNLKLDKFISTNTYQIPYLFNITSFHHVDIDNLTSDNMIFEQSLFKLMHNSSQLYQTTKTGQNLAFNVRNIKIKNKTCLKPNDDFGSALFHVSTIYPTNFIIQDSTISNIKMYQQMYSNDDMAVVVYFNDTKSQKSYFMAKNLTVSNNAFQYRKGLFGVQAQKVVFKDISFKNNQGQLNRHSTAFNNYDYTVEFNKIQSKGCIINVDAQKLEINNVDVDNVLSKEAGILSMVVAQPTDIHSLGTSSNNDLYLVEMHNCTFTNIMCYSGSILFDIDLQKIQQKSIGNRVNDLVLDLDRVMVKNVFSLKGGAVLKARNIKQEKISVKNSEFRSFKSGSIEQLIQFQFNDDRSEYNYDKQNYKLMFYSLNERIVDQNEQPSKLWIQNCTVDNVGVVNQYINYLQQVDFYNHRKNTKKDYWFANRIKFDKLISYTNKNANVMIDQSLLSFLKAIEKENLFVGGQLISVQNCIVDIKDSLINNIETLQSGSDNQFPLILKSTQNSNISISNTRFVNLAPNQKGLFEVTNSTFVLKDSQFDWIYDLHQNNSFEYQVKQKNQFSAKDNYTVYNVFNNDKYMRNDNLKQFKGGLIAYNSTIEIMNNRFERMKCKECSGLVLSIKQSLVKIMNNTFKNNSAQQASCIYIEGKQKVNSQLIPFVRSKGGHYIVEQSTMEISNNNFISNVAAGNSAGIYMKDIEIASIQNNVFAKNKAQYGSCLYSNEQKYNQNRSIVTYNNEFISNVATFVAQIYYQNIFIYNMNFNRFYNNVAGHFSSKVFSYAYKFKLNLEQLIGKNELIENEYTVDNFPSSQQMIPLNFSFFDELDGRVNLNQYVSSKAEFVKVIRVNSIRTFYDDRIKNTVYKQQQAYQVDQSIFNHPLSMNLDVTWVNNHFKIRASPLSQVVIEFKTDIIKQFDKRQKQFQNGGIFRLIINFMGCQAGEYYNKQQNYCQKCPNNTFSFDINQPCRRQESIKYMEHAYGGTKTSVQKGAWRSKNNTQIIGACKNAKHCQPNLQRFPDASNSSANYLCTTGHVGLLCQSCDHYGAFWNQSYQYSANDSQCVDCEDYQWKIVFYLIFLIILSLVIVYIVGKSVNINRIALKPKSSSKSADRQTSCNRRRCLMAVERVFANKAYIDSKTKNIPKMYPMKLKYKERDDGLSYDVYVDETDNNLNQQTSILKPDLNESIEKYTLIKILITYVLVLSVIVQIIQQQSRTLNQLQQIIIDIGQPVKQVMHSLECYIIMLGLKTVPVYLIQHIIVVITPLFIWLLTLLVSKLFLKTETNRPAMINYLILSVFYNYPQIVQNLLSAVCKQEYDGSSYIQADPKYLYSQQPHLTIRICFYAPVLVVLLIVIPVLFLHFLMKNVKNLDDDDFKAKYGFIYQEYHNEYYYIEFIKMGLRILILMASNIYIDSLQMQISVVEWTLLFYLIGMIITKPCIRHSANTIEFYSLTLCLLNLVLVNSIGQYGQIESQITAIVLLIILIMANIGFIYLVIYFWTSKNRKQVSQKTINQKEAKILADGSNLNTSLLWKQIFKAVKRTYLLKRQIQGQNEKVDSSNLLNNLQNVQQQQGNDRFKYQQVERYGSLQSQSLNSQNKFIYGGIMSCSNEDDNQHAHQIVNNQDIVIRTNSKFSNRLQTYHQQPQKNKYLRNDSLLEENPLQKSELLNMHIIRSKKHDNNNDNDNDSNQAKQDRPTQELIPNIQSYQSSQIYQSGLNSKTIQFQNLQESSAFNKKEFPIMLQSKLLDDKNISISSIEDQVNKGNNQIKSYSNLSDDDVRKISKIQSMNSQKPHEI